LSTPLSPRIVVRGRGVASRYGKHTDGSLTLAEGPWFFCLKHHTVETRDGCAERHRLGPYATREEAEHAVQSVAEREEKLTSEDRNWEGD
jgi:hypothetical protein